MTKKNGNALNRKFFINSENPRGRRPVTCRIAGKDPQNDNNYHLHVTTCIYAIKPRQIINYDAGIILIDLHQLNVKQLQTIQISDTKYGTTSCQRRTEPAEQQSATSAFLTK